MFGIIFFRAVSQNIPNGDFENKNANWKGNNFTYETELKVTKNDFDSKLGPVNGLQFLIISNSTKPGEIHNSFACNIRPDTFSFHVGYFRLFASEAFGIDILLTKWNTSDNKRDTVCYLHDTISADTGQIIPWFVINKALGKYYRMVELPDSASISFYTDIIPPVSSTTFMVLDECKWGAQAPSHKTFVSLRDLPKFSGQVYYENNRLHLESGNIGDLLNSKINIYNINGQLVYRNSIEKISGGIIIIDVPVFKNGMYILCIQNASQTLVNRFVVSK
jgi:hypothetical protein